MSLAAPAARRNIDEEIPILDLAPYLAGQPGALERLAGELRHAFDHIGFYFIKGHGLLPLRLVPAYPRAPHLPADDFAQAFSGPQSTLRPSPYPRVGVVEEDEFGIAPHTDASFMTVLAQNKSPGLSLRTGTGKWIDAP